MLKVVKFESEKFFKTQGQISFISKVKHTIKFILNTYMYIDIAHCKYNNTISIKLKKIYYS